MSKRWIFQDIKDAQRDVLYRTTSDAPMQEMADNMKAYYEVLREKVAPKTYVRYELWTCDIFVDVQYIISVTKAIYKDKVTRDQIMSWICKYKEDHHVLRGQPEFVHVQVKSK